MAGIGFELKKLFSHKGLIFQLRANLYATAVIAGPMIMGALLLFMMKYLSQMAGASGADQDALIVMIAWSILFPLILTSLFTFVLARYISDLLFEDDHEHVLPSMYGTIAICLIIGAAGWAVFLIAFNRIPFDYKALSFFLFCEAIIVWIQISYTNAVKDYRAVMMGFVYALLAALISAYVFVWLLRLPVITGLLAATTIAYGVMMIRYTMVLHAYFPVGKGTAIQFIKWIEKYPSLIFVGVFSTIGLFAHIMIMWASPWGVQAIGNFYHAPQHDIPVLLAFFVTLTTTVNFVTSVEVKFYPYYRIYFSLLNEGGSVSDIEKAHKEMTNIMKQELFYLAQTQLFVTITAIVVIGEIVDGLGLGFTSTMVGLFRVLCVGYGLYAIGNALMLFLLYLTNFRGAMWAAITLAVVNVLGTLFTITMPENFYGFGFLFAGLFMYLVGWMLLAVYIKKLDYHIYSKQPIFVEKRKSPLTRMIDKFETNWIKRNSDTI